MREYPARRGVALLVEGEGGDGAGVFVGDEDDGGEIGGVGEGSEEVA